MKKIVIVIIFLFILIPVAQADPISDFIRDILGFGITGKVVSQNPIILHRTVKDCGTNEVVVAEHEIDLRIFRNGNYRNYRCASRYTEQCINDGTFDTYYIESCEYETVYVNPSEDDTCTPVTCSSLGKQCGSWDDGCDGTVNCGVCSSGFSCSQGNCVRNAVQNREPVITSNSITSATENVVYRYDVNARDDDGDVLVYSLTTKPLGMVINDHTGLITWTPSNNQADQEFGVGVLVRDTSYNTVSQEFRVYVNPSEDDTVLNSGNEVINGQCGNIRNSCTSGNFVDVQDTDTDYLWRCDGINEGTSTNCHEMKLIVGLPVLTIASPSVSTYQTDESSLIVRGTATAGNSGRVSVRIFYNNIEQDNRVSGIYSSSLTFSKTINLIQGIKELKIIAKNNDDNQETTEIISIEYDSELQNRCTQTNAGERKRELNILLECVCDNSVCNWREVEDNIETSYSASTSEEIVALQPAEEIREPSSRSPGEKCYDWEVGVEDCAENQKQILVCDYFEDYNNYYWDLKERCGTDFCGSNNGDVSCVSEEEKIKESSGSELAGVRDSLLGIPVNVHKPTRFNARTFWSNFPGWWNSFEFGTDGTVPQQQVTNSYSENAEIARDRSNLRNSGYEREEEFLREQEELDNIINSGMIYYSCSNPNNNNYPCNYEGLGTPGVCSDGRCILQRHV